MPKLAASLVQLTIASFLSAASAQAVSAPVSVSQSHHVITYDMGEGMAD